MTEAKDLEIKQVTEAKDMQITAKEQEIKQVTEAKNQEIAAKDRQLSEKDSGLSSLQQRCGSLQTQLNTVQRRNESLEVSE